MVKVDLADRTPIRANLRLKAWRQIHLRKSLQHLLPIPIIVGFVIENQHQAGEPEQGHRPQMRQVRDTIHNDLERDGDLLLHLFGGPARPLRNDLDVVVGDVGIRLNRQVAERNQGLPDFPLKVAALA